MSWVYGIFHGFYGICHGFYGICQGFYGICHGFYGSFAYASLVSCECWVSKDRIYGLNYMAFIS